MSEHLDGIFSDGGSPPAPLNGFDSWAVDVTGSGLAEMGVIDPNYLFLHHGGGATSTIACTRPVVVGTVGKVNFALGTSQILLYTGGGLTQLVFAMLLYSLGSEVARVEVDVLAGTLRLVTSGGDDTTVGVTVNHDGGGGSPFNDMAVEFNQQNRICKAYWNDQVVEKILSVGTGSAQNIDQIGLEATLTGGNAFKGVELDSTGWAVDKACP